MVLKGSDSRSGGFFLLFFNELKERRLSNFTAGNKIPVVKVCVMDTGFIVI